jgi:hypothetical protein
LKLERFEVLVVMRMKMAVFWGFASCSLIDRYIDILWHFGRAYCFHHLVHNVATSQKTATFILLKLVLCFKYVFNCSLRSLLMTWILTSFQACKHIFRLFSVEFWFLHQ